MVSPVHYTHKNLFPPQFLVLSGFLLGRFCPEDRFGFRGLLKYLVFIWIPSISRRVFDI